MNALAKRGIERTQVTETLTMASPPNNAAPLLISVKAVDPAVYPFYGDVNLQPADGRENRAAAGYGRGIRRGAAAPERARRRYDSHRRPAVPHQRGSHERARSHDRQPQRRPARDDVARRACAHRTPDSPAAARRNAFCSRSRRQFRSMRFASELHKRLSAMR